MKYKNIVGLVALILIVDQAIKMYVKTHFFLGESVIVFPDWFQLSFIENKGMAFGMTIMDSDFGKLLLTSFRLFAVVFGFVWLKRLAKKGHSRGLLICGSLILAGATGNLIDSMFYGLIFTGDPSEIARFVALGQGYAGFMHGRVVDMFFFPIVEWKWPSYFPVIGGNHFLFFAPVFNLADAAISVGVITLLLFQKRFLPLPIEVAKIQEQESKTMDTLTEQIKSE